MIDLQHPGSWESGCFFSYRKAISYKVKKAWSFRIKLMSAGNGTWTHTWSPTTDFESASSAIPTRQRNTENYIIIAAIDFQVHFIVLVLFYLVKDIMVVSVPWDVYNRRNIETKRILVMNTSKVFHYFVRFLFGTVVLSVLAIFVLFLMKVSFQPGTVSGAETNMISTFMAERILDTPTADPPCRDTERLFCNFRLLWWV